MNDILGVRPIPCLDTNPAPGQSDAGIEAWRKLKFPDDDKHNMFERLYAGELLKTRPSDYEGRGEWQLSLTDRQREILDQASEKKEADLKVQAQRRQRAEKKRLNEAKRKRDGRLRLADHQNNLDERRAAYAAEKGGPVRSYNTSLGAAAMTAVERKAYQADRTQRMNDSLKAELASGRNPYQIAQLANKWDRMADLGRVLATVSRHSLCEVLLVKGHFDPTESAVVQLVKEKCESLGGYIAQPQSAPSDEDCASAVKKALNGLRAAGLIRRDKGLVRKSREVEVAEDQSIEKLPEYGIF